MTWLRFLSWSKHSRWNVCSHPHFKLAIMQMLDRAGGTEESARMEGAGEVRWEHARVPQTRATSGLSSRFKGCVCMGGWVVVSGRGASLLTGGRVSRILPDFPTLSVHYYPKFSGGGRVSRTKEVCRLPGHGIIVLNWHSLWMHSS